MKDSLLHCSFLSSIISRSFFPLFIILLFFSVPSWSLWIIDTRHLGIDHLYPHAMAVFGPEPDSYNISASIRIADPIDLCSIGSIKKLNGEMIGESINFPKDYYEAHELLRMKMGKERLNNIKHSNENSTNSSPMFIESKWESVGGAVLNADDGSCDYDPSHPTIYYNSIILAQRGPESNSCMFSRKACNAQKLGAKGLIIGDNTATFDHGNELFSIAIMGANADSVSQSIKIPSIFIRKGDFLTILANITNTPSIDVKEGEIHRSESPIHAVLNSEGLAFDTERIYNSLGVFYAMIFSPFLCVALSMAFFISKYLKNRAALQSLHAQMRPPPPLPIVGPPVVVGQIRENNRDRSGGNNGNMAADNDSKDESDSIIPPIPSGLEMIDFHAALGTNDNNDENKTDTSPLLSNNSSSSPSSSSTAAIIPPTPISVQPSNEQLPLTMIQRYRSGGAGNESENDNNNNHPNNTPFNLSLFLFHLAVRIGKPTFVFRWAIIFSVIQIIIGILMLFQLLYFSRTSFDNCTFYLSLFYSVLICRSYFDIRVTYWQIHGNDALIADQLSKFDRCCSLWWIYFHLIFIGVPYIIYSPPICTQRSPLIFSTAFLLLMISYLMMALRLTLLVVLHSIRMNYAGEDAINNNNNNNNNNNDNHIELAHYSSFSSLFNCSIYSPLFLFLESIATHLSAGYLLCGSIEENTAQERYNTVIAIFSLPQIPFREGLYSGDDASCPICMGDYQNGENLRILHCRHHFHSQCVDRWLLQKRSCPLCISSILPEERQREERRRAADRLINAPQIVQ